MNIRNKILAEKFLSEIKIIIESNYILDREGNILLKVSKNQLRGQCNEMINEYAKEIGESEEQLRSYLLNTINNQLNEKDDDGIKFYKERKLVKEILLDEMNQSKDINKENDELER